MSSYQIISSLNDPALIDLLTQGKVGVIPSDTQYGLMALAADKLATTRLYSLKHRTNKPGTLIAASSEQLINLGLKPRYVKAVEHLWPNSLSIILPLGPELSYLHLDHHDLAVRIPGSSQLIKLLKKTGPLITTSANSPGAPPANSLQEAIDYFGDTVDFYVDGGDLSNRPPSTIIRIIDDAIEVVRKGAVNIDENGRITT
jgi:L-threonylcarbamoyladenylate synthase